MSNKGVLCLKSRYIRWHVYDCGAEQVAARLLDKEDLAVHGITPDFKYHSIYYETRNFEKYIKDQHVPFVFMTETVTLLVEATLVCPVMVSVLVNIQKFI
ncbi:hypothetical protein OSTOST_05534 [Ostertagia ostertagi]